LLGDPTKAKERLGWEPLITAEAMCEEMIAEDLRVAKRYALLKQHGYAVPVALES
jgi:GDPmannose 4,6-dehydratase